MKTLEQKRRERKAAPSANGKHGAKGFPVSANSNPDNPPVELLIESYSTMKAKPVRWLVPQRIPLGKVTLIAGRGGNGKSTATRHLTACCSTGRPAFGLLYDPIDPFRVLLILAGEDGDDDTILPHLLAEDADVSKIDVLKYAKVGDSKKGFCLGCDYVKALKAKLLADPTIKLVIIDPIASFVGRSKVDDHRSTELRQLLDPLNELATDANVAIIIIAHLNKSNGPAVDRVSGSGAYRDAVRCAYLACEDPDDDTRRFLMPFKENLPGFDKTALPFALEPLTPIQADMVMDASQFDQLDSEDRALMAGQLRRVRFDTAVSVNPDEVMAPKKEDKNKVQRCVEWLAEYLKDFAAPADMIEEEAGDKGFTRDNVCRAKAKLKLTANLHNSNRGRFQGKWWSGFGHPDTWKLRPDIPESPKSPDIPDIG